jgi:dCTP deaminase
MTEGVGNIGLFPMDEGPGAPTNIIKYRETGIIPYQGLNALMNEGAIAAIPAILPEQVQPASLDLRLGQRAYRVRASFLPGPEASVMDRVRQLDGMPPIDLSEGAVLEKGAVYVVELAEHLRLTGDYFGMANPKSSTGRLDVLTRLITDRAVAFDKVERGYKGPLYLEIAPLTFSVVVRRGTRLNQLRLQRGSSSVAQSEIQRLYESGQLAKVDGKLAPLRDGLVPVTVDLKGAGPGSIVGYKARKNSRKIDADQVRYYDPNEFWDEIKATDGHLNLDQGDFYILASREEIGVPPHLAAEMVPYDTASGEFRVHYAGFFDPGFGWNAGAGGSKAVLEVRSYGVSFTLEHGQIVGWLDYRQVATGRTDQRYGEGLKSNYQGQGVALAKHFKISAP